MTIYESELALVKKRLEDINDEKSRPGNKIFVIASGDPVLEEYRDEYVALKRMQEILENNFEQSEDYEYLNARKNTNLPKLATGMEERFIHSNNQVEDQSISTTPVVEPSPQSAFQSPTSFSGKKLSQEEIEQLLARKAEDPGLTPEPVVQPAPAPVQGGKMSQEEIQRIIYSDNGEFMDFYGDYDIDPSTPTEVILKTINDEKKYLRSLKNIKTAKDEIDMLELLERAFITDRESYDREYTKVKARKNISSPEPVVQAELTPIPQPAQTPVPPVQQQDNLIYLTPEQLERLVTDAVTKALAQLNLRAETQTHVAPHPEKPQIQEIPVPEENTVPPESIEQAPDLTEEQQAAMAEAILHGTPEKLEDDDDLEPIVKISKWQWIKNHKKPILIALGVTAMALTVALGLPNLFPALKTAASSAELANLAGQMAENSQLAAMNTADHLSLHSANTALAEQITNMSSIKHTFDAATGSWTFGTKGLQDFITSQLSKAAEAKDTASAIKAAMTAGGITSFGLIGTGLILPRTKSKEFKDIAKNLKEYTNNIEFTTNNDLDAKHDDFERKITESTTLKNWEKKKLLKKLKKAQKKVDYEIQYRDDPNFEAGMALGEALSEPEGRSL